MAFAASGLAQLPKPQETKREAKEEKNVSGTVKSVDPTNKTLTIELSKDYGNKKKGEQMTFYVGDKTKWEGSPWQSLSDVKPGQQIEFQALESAGRYEIQRFSKYSSATGAEQSQGARKPSAAGDQGQIRPTEPTKQGETGQQSDVEAGKGSQIQTQPGQQGQSGQPQTQSSQSGHEPKNQQEESPPHQENR